MIFAFLLGVLAMTAVTQLTMTPKTTLGRRKATQERAFVLNVGLSFRSQGVADGFIKEWGRAADYCMANEDFVFAYELAQSDQDPLRYIITERYRSKADYLGAHRSSSAFKVTSPRAPCPWHARVPHAMFRALHAMPACSMQWLLSVVACVASLGPGISSGNEGLAGQRRRGRHRVVVQ